MTNNSPWKGLITGTSAASHLLPFHLHLAKNTTGCRQLLAWEQLQWPVFRSTSPPQQSLVEQPVQLPSPEKRGRSEQH